jgi:hypothetical protein
LQATKRALNDFSSFDLDLMAAGPILWKCSKAVGPRPSPGTWEGNDSLQLRKKAPEYRKGREKPDRKETVGERDRQVKIAGPRADVLLCFVIPK